MSRIMVTPMGSLGDLPLKIAIALALRKRGYEVVFATHQNYQPQVAALGFEFQRVRPDLPMLHDPQATARMMDLRRGSK